MKRIGIIILLGLWTVAVMAADLPAQGLGLHIGYAQPTLRLNSSNTSYPKDSLVNTTQLHGLKVGVVYDGSFIKGFGTSLGINYTFGTTNTPWARKYSLSEYPQIRSKVFYHAIEVFVDWQYKFEVAQETYLILYTGPTIQYGLALTQKGQQNNFGTYSAYPEGDCNRYLESDPNIDLQRLNVTWGVGAGFQYKRYFLRGGYDFGLINPYKQKQFTAADGTFMDRNTRGRLDQWEIKIGAYLWYSK